MRALHWVAIVLFLSVGANRVALASSITVPDDSPTVQGAVDTGVDTVYVRAGQYPESPRVSYQTTLVGIPSAVSSDLPELSGLEITPLYTEEILARFAFVGVRFAGKVSIDNSDNPCWIIFGRCALLGGLEDRSLYVTTGAYSIEHSELTGAIECLVDGECHIDSCTINGSVYVGEGNAKLYLDACTFTGRGVGAGIAGTVYSADIANSTINGYTVGIGVSADDIVHVRGNDVRRCGGIGIDVSAAGAYIIGNVVKDCSMGIIGSSYDLVDVEDNYVFYSARTGVYVSADNARLRRNIIAHSGRDGCEIDGGAYARVEVTNNTFARNGDSGLSTVIDVGVLNSIVVRNNVSWQNGSYGITWFYGRNDRYVVGCNDIVDNARGSNSDSIATPGDVAMAPMFCDPDSDDFQLMSGSALIALGSCGLVGALGKGCELTETVVTSFAAVHVVGGVKVTWRFATGVTVKRSWAERAIGDSGPWEGAGGVVANMGDECVEIDGSASPTEDYWYRVMAEVGSGKNVVAGPIVLRRTELQRRGGLISVAPSPGRGPFKIQFNVDEAGVVEIAVLDIQGRSVWLLKSGMLPPGNHSVEWDGRARGEALSPGVYMVRYRDSRGQDTRRVVVVG